MNAVTFYRECPKDVTVKYAVIVAHFHGKWVLCRHKSRNTWEIPGGHIEEKETPEQAAVRELWEETGAARAEIRQVCAYSFSDYGALFYAEISALAPIPDTSEIAEIGLFDALPDNLTYPHIQPALFEQVQAWLRSQIE